MFTLKLYRSARLPHRADLDLHPLDETFRSYLHQGWLHGPVGSGLLFTLARGFWDDRDGALWYGPNGLQPALQLPEEVKLALTLAENSRRNRWTAMPGDLAADDDAMTAVWQALSAQPLDFRLALRFYEDRDRGLLAFLRQESLPVRVRMGGRCREGRVEEVFRALVRPPHPMSLLHQVKRLRKTLYPGWKEDGPPFVPRRAAELGYGDWTFRSWLTAEPYRLDGSPLLHSRVPTCLTVTRHADGRWALGFPRPDTLTCPCLPAGVNGYDELLALCGAGLAPGDRRWALVCDTEASPRVPLASPCFGFAFDTTARTLCLTEEENALERMQAALAGLLRSAGSQQGGDTDEA